jgi:hypothetical protein
MSAAFVGIAFFAIFAVAIFILHVLSGTLTPVSVGWSLLTGAISATSLAFAIRSSRA